MNKLLLDNGEPDLDLLQSWFTRCTPMNPGGTQWMDDIRFCRWQNQWMDGRKHDSQNDAKGEAQPWDGASDCRPFTVDDIINERAAMKTTAFWRSLMRPASGNSESSQYAVALAEHLVGVRLYDTLTREVELAAQYEEHYGWALLAPRWRREVGLKRVPVKMELLDAQAAQAPEEDAMRQLPNLIRDRELEAAAVDWVRAWYDGYAQREVPAEMRDRVPGMTEKAARRAVRELRDTGETKVVLPYLCKNEPEIVTLKPWEEAFLPPEMVDEQQVVFQRELLSEPDLRGKMISDGYDEEWVAEAVKHKGEVLQFHLPVGQSGNAMSTMGTAPSHVAPTTTQTEHGLVEVLYAVYKAVDEEGVPGIYMTTFHRSVNKTRTGRALYAKHELVDSPHGEVPYTATVREWWTRSVTASRGVPVVSHTHQNVIKGLIDGILDRSSISMMPPVNVYESPTGVQYRFGPAAQNYVRQGKEPAFMEMPSGSGLVDGTKAYDMVRRMVDNQHGLLSEAVPPPRAQMSQGMAVQRFLLAWSKAIQQMLCLCQMHMPDAEFAQITGAPEGWLDGKRYDTGLLKCELHFDVRELDPELTMAQIKAVNEVVLPTDTLGVVNRGNWTKTMLRGINPMWAKELIVPQNDASQQTLDRARKEVLQMFAGNTPQWLDDKDPTAGGLLEYSKQVVMSNPVYLQALNDEALQAVAGQMAPAVAQQLEQMGGRSPNERFSELLLKWIKNLTFVGVTQVENKQIGRIGVRPEV